MANGFIYIRNTEKATFELNGSPTIVNKIKQPFIAENFYLDKIPVIDTGVLYDTADNVVDFLSPTLLAVFDLQNMSYPVTIDGTSYDVIFTPINAEKTEFGVLVMAR